MKTKSNTIKTLKIELQEKLAFLNDNLHILEDLDDNLTVTCDTAEELLHGILANKLVKTFKIPTNLESIRTPAVYGFMLCNENTKLMQTQTLEPCYYLQ